jgi:hypothetical protein
MKISTIVLLFALCAAVAPLAAQINITTSDVVSNYLGFRWIATGDSSTATVNLGTASLSPQTFDFSGITVNPATYTRDTSNFLTPAGHLNAADFPTASACFQTVFVFSSGPITQTQTLAEYLSAESDGAYLLGFAERIQTVPPFGPFPADTTLEAKFHPKQLGIPLPLTRGTSRTTTDTLVNPSIGGGNTTEITTHTFTADAFGTVTLPGGSSFSGIRLWEDKVRWTTNTGGTTRSRSLTVTFYGQNLTQISFDVDTAFTGGTVQLTNYSISQKDAPLGVKQMPGARPREFALLQNYPNPFNPVTQIAFSIPAREYVSLKVYNILGEEVATLRDGDMSPGSYTAPFDAGALPSGLYFYRLRAGSFTETKKMSVLK